MQLIVYNVDGASFLKKKREQYVSTYSAFYVYMLTDPQSQKMLTTISYESESDNSFLSLILFDYQIQLSRNMLIPVIEECSDSISETERSVTDVTFAAL